MQVHLNSTSAVAVEVTTSLLKVLGTIAVSYEAKLTAVHRKQFIGWSLQAEEFIKQFKLGLVNYKNMVKEIAGGNDPQSKESLDNRVIAFAESLKQNHSLIHKETDVTREHLSFIKDFSLYIRAGSDPAYLRLHKNVSMLGEPELNKVWTDDDTSDDILSVQSLTKVDLKKAVKKLIGRTDIVMTKEESVKARTKNPEVYKHYLKLRRVFNEVPKNRIRQLVRSSGKPYLPYDQVIDTLKREKIEFNMPTGFVGNIGEAGEFYTITGKKLKASPAGNVEIVMNPKYNPVADNAYVFKANLGAGWQRYQTIDNTAHGKKKRFKKVNLFAKDIVKVRDRWRKDLIVDGDRQIAAVLCELAYHTQARISSKSAQTAGKQTYGLSTLQKQHIKIKGNTIHIRYPAKKGIITTYKLDLAGLPSLKKVKTILEHRMSSMQPKDYVLLIPPKNVIASSVYMKDYLKHLGAPAGITMHNFRHLKGTMLAKSILQKSPFNPKDPGSYTETDVNNWLKKAMEAVGEKLGHMHNEKVTGKTAIVNYIDPSVINDFFDKLGVRPSKDVQKTIDSVKADSKY